MTPKQALDLLAQRTGVIQLKRDDHQEILKAIGVLNGLIQAKEEEETKSG